MRRQRLAARHSKPHRSAPGKRARGNQLDVELPFSPPEDWHEPCETRRGDPYAFRIVEQPAGPEYRHVLTPAEIRARLGKLPPSFIGPLETVQLSRMTRKKERYACYGMQWGTTLYLYPLEEGRVEYHDRPPTPSQVQEAEMYGGRWIQTAAGQWQLSWTEVALKDFYLNNILIHELGHLLDDRNTSYVDRERFAEWFALRYGYQASRRLAPAARRRRPRRRHAR